MRYVFRQPADHIANIIELLGEDAKSNLADMAKTGQYASDIFSGSGTYAWVSLQQH